MQENIDDQTVKEFNKPYKDLSDLDKKHICQKEIFEYIFYFEEPAEREKIIMELEERAKEVGAGPNFKRIYKQYEKIFSRNNKNNNNLIKQSHNEIGDMLLKNNYMYIFENDICIYKDGVYKKNGKEISKKILELVPDSTIHFRNEVYQYLLLKAEEKQFDRENGIINFKNGLFSIKEKKMYEHSPEYFSTNQINTKLNLQAPKVQAIDNVLEKLSSGNIKRKQTILEMIGYSMTTSVKLQKAFILYGKTARNGKSTLIDIIGHLLGDENIGTTSFKDMNQNKFAGAGIKNKLLNSGSEMTDEYIVDVEIFKKYVTGDYLEIEEKFKPRQKIRPYAKFIFSANELPRVADKTNGFYRRLQIIPLEYSFTDKDRKTFDFNKLISKEAMEYLAKISLEAYLDMGEKFSNYEESSIEVEKYKIETNNVLSFINDEDYLYPIIEENCVRYASWVYEYYKNYCIQNQYKAIGMKRFYKEIEKSKLIFKVGNHKKQKVYTFNKDFYKPTPPTPPEKIN